ASATSNGTSGTSRGRTAPRSMSAEVLRGVERAADFGTQRRGPPRRIDVDDGVAAANAQLVGPLDLPRVRDRGRADLLRDDLELELVLESQHREILGLDGAARVVRPVVEEAERAQQRRLRRLCPAKRSREVDAAAG